MTLDRYDALAVIGLACMGAAIGWGMGLPGLLAYVGMVLLLVGITGARAKNGVGPRRR